MTTLILSLALLGQAESAGPLIDRWEARADRIEQRLAEHNREARRWNDFAERWEARFDKWDGSRIWAFLQAAWKPIDAIFAMLRLALYALIAVCVARSIREVSEGVRILFYPHKAT